MNLDQSPVIVMKQETTKKLELERRLVLDMYDVWSSSLTSDVMEYEDAIELYNEVAAKYNEIVALYDTCDCVSAGDSSKNLPRIPLYDPETIPDHTTDAFGYNWPPDLLNKCICGAYEDSSGRTGVGIIQVIAALCKELDDLSLKQHGPNNSYQPNGYVQLYTEIEKDSDGNPIIDPETGNWIEHKNGTDVDYINNVCSDLDFLEPSPGSSTFLETKVYPILNTVDPENANTLITAAKNTFNIVAALPKRAPHIEQSHYSVGYTILYSMDNWDTSNTGVQGITWHVKQEYVTVLEDVYDKLIGYIKTDYNNWLNNLPSTLATDIAGLEARYTKPYVDDQHATTQLTIASADMSGNINGMTHAKRLLSKPPSSYISDLVSINHRDHMNIEYYKFVPAVSYSLSFDLGNGREACRSAYIGPIAFSVAKVGNVYQQKLYLNGITNKYSEGELTIMAGRTPHRFPLAPISRPRSYNALGHLMSVTYSECNAGLEPCDSQIFAFTSEGDSSPIDYLDEFPSLTWDTYNNMPYPNDPFSTNGPAVIYDGTTYYRASATHTPATYMNIIYTTPYMLPSEQE